MKMLLHTYLLKCTKTNSFHIYNLPSSLSPNIGKIKVKVGSKTTRNFLLFEYILNVLNIICIKYNVLLTVILQNTFSKLVELLQLKNE